MSEDRVAEGGEVEVEAVVREGGRVREREKGGRGG